MADDKSKQSARDRNQVAAGEPYEVAYFAEKHGLSQDEARRLIDEVGNDRDKLDAAAEARGGTPKAPAKSASKGASVKRPRAASRSHSSSADASTLAAVAEPLAAGAKIVRRRAAKATDAVAPVGKVVVERADAIASAVRRSTATAGKRVAAVPAAVGKSASKALGATKSAATGRTAVLVGAAAAGLVTGLAVNLGRKAVVQAPSVIAGDWFEALKVEHKMALAIFDQLEKTIDTEKAKRTLFLTQLKHALGKHAFTEENVIYPALRDWGDKADADKLNHDHGYVKQYLYELDALDKGSPAFLARVGAFRADLEAHIREEEDAIFPPLHAALDDVKNAHITALANKEGFKLA